MAYIYFKFFFLFLIIGIRPIYALISFDDATYPALAPSGRAQGMGNAFICKTDDSAAVFYNPAGLGSVRISHFHLTNFHFETNEGLVNSTTGGNAAQIGSNVAKGFSVDGTRELLNQFPGTVIYNRVSAMPNLITRYMSMGYMYSLQKKYTLGTQENALFEYASRQDHGPYWAMNISIFGGIIKFGGTGVYLNRKELYGESPPLQTVEINDDDYKIGKALVVIGGGRLTLPIAFLPTFAATAHNVTGTQFTAGGGAGAPDMIKQSIDVGFSLTPQLTKTIRLHVEVNYQDLTGQYNNVAASNKLQAGAEFDFFRSLFVRFGYSDGFGSYGVGIKTRKLEFDLSSYAISTTSNEFRGEEDRRYSLSLSAGI